MIWTMELCVRVVVGIGWGALIHGFPIRSLTISPTVTVICSNPSRFNLIENCGKHLNGETARSVSHSSHHNSRYRRQVQPINNIDSFCSNCFCCSHKDAVWAVRFAKTRRTMERWIVSRRKAKSVCGERAHVTWTPMDMRCVQSWKTHTGTEGGKSIYFRWNRLCLSNDGNYQLPLVMRDVQRSAHIDTIPFCHCTFIHYTSQRFRGKAPPYLALSAYRWSIFFAPFFFFHYILFSLYSLYVLDWIASVSWLWFDSVADACLHCHRGRKRKRRWWWRMERVC